MKEEIYLDLLFNGTVIFATAVQVLLLSEHNFQEEMSLTVLISVWLEQQLWTLSQEKSNILEYFANHKSRKSFVVGNIFFPGFSLK